MRTIAFTTSRVRPLPETAARSNRQGVHRYTVMLFPFTLFFITTYSPFERRYARMLYIASIALLVSTVAGLALTSVVSRLPVLRLNASTFGYSGPLLLNQ